MESKVPHAQVKAEHSSDLQNDPEQAECVKSDAHFLTLILAIVNRASYEVVHKERNIRRHHEEAQTDWELLRLFLLQVKDQPAVQYSGKCTSAQVQDHKDLKVQSPVLIELVRALKLSECHILQIY